MKKKPFKRISFQPKNYFESMKFSTSELKRNDEKESFSILSHQKDGITIINENNIGNQIENPNQNERKKEEIQIHLSSEINKKKRQRKPCLWRTVPYFCYRWGMTEEEVKNELMTNKYLKKG